MSKTSYGRPYNRVNRQNHYNPQDPTFQPLGPWMPGTWTPDARG